MFVFLPWLLLRTGSYFPFLMALDLSILYTAGEAGVLGVTLTSMDLFLVTRGYLTAILSLWLFVISDVLRFLVVLDLAGVLYFPS